MLCGLQLPAFTSPKKPKPERVRPVISAPIPYGSDPIMDTWQTVDASPNAELGTLYLVPNPSGTGKILVRRPGTPQTSAPLDDNFDEPTQLGTLSVVPDFARSLPPPPRRVKPPVASASMTRPTIGAIETSPRSSAPTQRSRTSPSVTSSSPRSAVSKGKGRPDPSIGREYSKYMDEMQTMFGTQGDLDVSVNRRNEQSGARESITIGRVKSTKRSAASSPPGYIMSKVSPVSPASRRPSTRSSGQRARDFEEISRRVVESTPEKTVTISTWREHVPQDQDDRFERMSVYFVGPDIDPEAIEHAGSELESFRSPVQTRSPQMQRTMQELSMEDTARSPRAHRTMQELSMEDNLISPDNSIEASRARHTGEFTEVSKAAPSWIRPSQYLPNPVHLPPASSLSSSSSSPFSTSSSSGVGTSPPASQVPPTPPPKSPRTARRGPNRHPIQVDSMRYEMPSFFPTQDGSIISTIKSSGSSIVDNDTHAVGPASVRAVSGLEQILGTCRPSLAHLAPTLSKLGIMTKDHLHALADLDPETRDRELREEALKNGVTNMEWAILVNRLKTLSLAPSVVG